MDNSHPVTGSGCHLCDDFRAAGSGTRLPLVAAAQPGGTVRVPARRRQPNKRQLPNFHPVPEPYGERGTVGQFQRQLAVPAWVNEAGRAVYHQPDAAQAAFALQPCRDVVRQGYALNGGPQRKFVGTEYEHPFVADVRVFQQTGSGCVGSMPASGGGCRLWKRRNLLSRVTSRLAGCRLPG